MIGWVEGGEEFVRDGWSILATYTWTHAAACADNCLRGVGSKPLSQTALFFVANTTWTNRMV